MTKEKRRLSIIMALFMTFFTLTGANEVYAAQVGDQLYQPEKVWKRYDDYDNMFVSENMKVFHNNSKVFLNGVSIQHKICQKNKV